MGLRVTNNMIMNNSSVNINGTKVLVDHTNTQMTTQKKISRPSEDPVTAIRSLRFSTSLSQINQYYEKNIPDAESWLEVTETALVNMRNQITDYRSLCDQGANGTLTQDDRNTILTQLKSLQQGIYAEGNADYAGRTVFTGYRTDKQLTFSNAETETVYEIKQDFKASQMEEYSYYNGKVTVPANATELSATENIGDMTKNTYQRIRLGYDGGEMNSITITTGSGDSEAVATFTLRSQNDLDVGYTPADMPAQVVSAATTGASAFAGKTVRCFDTEENWAAASANTPPSKDVGDDELVYIQETGELIFGDNIAAELQSAGATISADYTKTGFKSGELRPEYYYNCTDQSDRFTKDNWINYTKYDENGDEKNYDIEYIIANNQPLAINLEACDIFDTSIYQDMSDALEAVSSAIDAHDKLDRIDTMINMEQYADEASQAQLLEWKTAIQKEADFYDDNLQSIFSRYLGKADVYLDDMSLAVTQVGCKADQLELTENRMNSQQETVMELQSKNDDVDLSDIILKYTAAYTAYQASLTAAGKLGESSLLNYI